MLRKLFLLASLLLYGVAAYAQTAVKPTAVSGEVSSLAAEKIVLKTANGDLEAVLTAATQFFRVPPENPTLKAAVASSVGEISVGDKLVVSGILADDKKSLPARSVYLMSKSEIAAKQAKEQAEWRTRGISGRVEGYNPQTNVITVSVRGLMGERKVSITPKEGAEFYRYAPDSVKFSEAKKGTIAELEPGDSIRALGDKSPDGAEIKAERIVTGAFRTVGGRITAINPATNEVTITDVQTKKPLTIVVTDASVLKQFPEEMANRLAGMQLGGAGTGGMRPPTQSGAQTTQNPQPNPQPQTPGQTPNGMGGGMRQGGGIDDMLDRFPSVKLADLKVGQAIAVSSTKSTDPTRIRAIKLLSGVEPFIKMSEMAAAQQGGGGRNAGGGGASLNIPGLDGFGGN